MIVLEPGLVIYKIYNGYWFLGRPTLEELRQDLRAVSKKCRPDWDITTPELKSAWEQGRKDLFYPYGTQRPELLLVSGNFVVSDDNYTWSAIAHGRSSRVTDANYEVCRTRSRPGSMIQSSDPSSCV